MKLENSDFVSLIETRVLLEIQTAKLAAQRRTSKDIENIKTALNTFEESRREGKQAVEEDLIFHLKIAEASKNTVLNSLMLVIIPDVVRSFINLDFCKGNRLKKAMKEHHIIMEHIIAQEPDDAAEAMRLHLKDVLDYSQSLRHNRSNGSSKS